MHIVTIDTGTTNTRTSLWRDGRLLGQASAEVGVRDTAITGSKDALRHALRDTIRIALAQAGVAADQVALAIASGMIGSNVGLAEVPHLVAPAGVAELARGMVQLDMPEVFSRPLWFIPGVRNHAGKVGLHNHEAMDMIRGEETETMGLLSRLNLAERAMLVLPGSHTKFVSIDDEQRIVGCATTVAGELLQAITQHTLISQSLDAGFGRELHPEMVLAGAAAAKKVGLARACFSVRILAQFSDVQRDERASFLLGAVLSDDLLALKNSSAIQMRPDTTIVICGKPMLRDALALLIAENRFFYGKRIIADDAQQADLAGVGAMVIAAARHLIPTMKTTS
jgi:2-dehydro-3-deoxygalactonokinase